MHNLSPTYPDEMAFEIVCGLWNVCIYIYWASTHLLFIVRSFEMFVNCFASSPNELSVETNAQSALFLLFNISQRRRNERSPNYEMRHRNSTINYEQPSIIQRNDTVIYMHYFNHFSKKCVCVCVLGTFFRFILPEPHCLMLSFQDECRYSRRVSHFLFRSCRWMPQFLCVLISIHMLILSKKTHLNFSSVCCLYT